MRKFLLFLTIVMVFAAGSVSAAPILGDVTIALDNVTNQFSPTQLTAGKTHTFSVRYDCSEANAGALFIGTNSFEVYSPDLADWTGLQAAYGPLALTLSPTTQKFLQHYQFNGTTFVRTASMGAVPAIGYTPGVCEKAGFALSISSSDDGWEGAVDNAIAVTATITSRKVDDGLHLCFDTVKAQGMQAWEWAYGSDAPTNLFFDNGLGANTPRCWEVYDPPNQPPVFDSPTGVKTFNHCDMATFTLVAHDQDLIPNDPPVITYEFAPGFETGFGEIVGNEWRWSGTTVPQSGFVDILFYANDGAALSDEPFTLHVTIENEPPVITCPGGLVTVTVGTQKCQNVTFSDPDDCDSPTISVIDWTGDETFLGDVVTVAGNSICFTPDITREQGNVDMVVEVTDGELTATCTLFWFVGTGSPYQVEITKDSMTFQGGYEEISIVLHKADPADGIGGFDFLLAYDASALSFQSATEGDIYTECTWEYFTYRFGPDGVCGSGCPSGMLSVTGMAETNNGPYHPICNVGHVGYVDQDMLPITLANLKFLISNDRTLECNYVPVRFFWMNCGDNAISNFDGSKLYLSEKLYEFVAYNDPFVGGLLEGTFEFPTYGGTQATLEAEDCYFEDVEHNKFALPGIGFQNGGFDIACADSIDARGDINLNGLPYEIADAVMFTNYFVNGPVAFGTHYEGSVAASDCNADGLALTVADLVYLIRVVIGDAQAIPKTSPLAAKFTVSGDTYGIDTEAGAAYLVFEGTVTPTLLADNMKMQYATVNGNTNVLIFRDDVAGETFVGDFVRANGRLITSEFATYDGQPMVAKLVPTSFAVEQNYPNPFNPTTDISFSIPNGGAWKLDIYNITGQLVQSYSGVSETGIETVTWDASGKASGIYFYKVSAGDNSITKKAVLIK